MFNNCESSQNLEAQETVLCPFLSGIGKPAYFIPLTQWSYFYNEDSLS